MTKIVTNVVLGLFLVAGTLSTIACSGADSSVGDPSSGQDQSELKKPTTPPQPTGCGTGNPPPSTCQKDVIGDGKTCVADYDWKRAGLAHCEALKLQLTSVSLGPSCGPNSAYQASVECCSYPVAPPGPPTPSPACDGRTAGGGPGTVCQTETSWKQYAIDDCKKDGLTVGELSYDLTGCVKGTASAVKFTCCK